MSARKEATSPASQPELFTASQLARFCQVDLKTIHNWVDKGEIRHFRTPGRHLRFRREDVVDFLKTYGYPIPESLQGGKPRVTVVDDDAAELATVRRALAKRFEVSTFTDAIEALVAVGAQRPDAIVWTAPLPGFNVFAGVDGLKRAASTTHVRCVVQARDGSAVAPPGSPAVVVARGDTGALRDALERATGLERE